MKTLKKHITLLILLLLFFTGVGFLVYQYYSSQENKYLTFELELQKHQSKSINFKQVSTKKRFHSNDFSIVLYQFSYSDSTSNSVNRKTFYAKKITIDLALNNLLNKEIKIKHVLIEDGGFIQNKYARNIKLKNEQKNIIDTLLDPEHWMQDAKAKIELHHFYFDIHDFEKNKHSCGHINDLQSTFVLKKNKVIAHVAIDIEMDKMGLNLKNGTFFNQARLKGQFSGTYNYKDQLIEVPTFELYSDKQRLLTKILINVRENKFKFNIDIPQANYSYCNSLLSQNIQKKLINYNFSNPINVAASIEGSFAYHNNPLITIHFKTTNNKAIGNDFEVDSVCLEGVLKNTLTSSNEIHQIRKKDLYITTNLASGVFRGIYFDLDSFMLTSTPEEKINVNLILKATGTPNYLSELFRSKVFYFENGIFNLDMSYSGKLNSMKDILAFSTSDFRWRDGSFFYKKNNINIPITYLHFSINEEQAELHQLLFQLNEGEQMTVTGIVKNARTLMLPEETAPIEIQANIYSPKLRWNNLLKLFSHRKNNTNNKRSNTAIMKAALKDLYREVNPTISIQIDTLFHNNVQLDSLRGTLSFKNENEATLSNAHVNIAQGSADLNIVFDLSDSLKTYFESDFESKNIRLNPLFRSFNYFNLSTFKKAEYFDGIATIDAQLKGAINDDTTGVESKSLTGPISFKINHGHLKNFEPIQKIASKIFSNSRVKDIYFAPLNDAIYIEDNTIYIPRMEIQSTAFVFFLEGRLSYENNNNLWITIPWKNLKRWDISQTPENIGYANNGRKFFIQIFDEVKADSIKRRYALRWNNKRMYKELGIKKEYRYDKQENMRRFRFYKKTNRKDLNK